MIKTTKQEIAAYWSVVYPDMNLDSSHCWRCKIKKRLDRCHIQAASIKGSDEPSNFVLLCKHCHIDSPNIENPSFIWTWLLYYHGRQYHDLWYERGVREYERIFNVDFAALILGHEAEFHDLFKQELSKATRHFGQPSLNPATVAGVISETIQSMHKKRIAD